jgi:hypothetical protein
LFLQGTPFDQAQGEWCSPEFPEDENPRFPDNALRRRTGILLVVSGAFSLGMQEYAQ